MQQAIQGAETPHLAPVVHEEGEAALGHARRDVRHCALRVRFYGLQGLSVPMQDRHT